MEKVVSTAESKGFAQMPCFPFLCRAPQAGYCIRNWSGRASPLKTWAVVTMLCMAALNTVPYNRQGKSTEVV